MKKEKLVLVYAYNVKNFLKLMINLMYTFCNKTLKFLLNFRNLH